jgi:hypothetical protein
MNTRIQKYDELWFFSINMADMQEGKLKNNMC